MPKDKDGVDQTDVQTQTPALEIGDRVIYREQSKYVPGVVEAVYPLEEGKTGNPDIAVVYFMTGFAGAAVPRSRVSYGKKVGEYLLNMGEVRAAQEEEKKAAEEQYRKQVEEVSAANAKAAQA